MDWAKLKEQKEQVWEEFAKKIEQMYKDGSFVNEVVKRIEEDLLVEDEEGDEDDSK